MRIERISDTQVKFYLTNDDLSERDIKLSELVYGSEKAQALFREITEQAASACGFTADNGGESIPLMVEATQDSDGIVIIVSKVTNMNDMRTEIESRFARGGKPTDFGLSPAGMTERRFRSKKPELETYKMPEDDDSLTIYSFDSINTAAKAVSVLSDIFAPNAESRLYLCEKRYYLLIRSDNILNSKSGVFDDIMTEYGKKESSSGIASAHIKEHGELVIKNNAVNVLAAL